MSHILVLGDTAQPDRVSITQNLFLQLAGLGMEVCWLHIHDSEGSLGVVLDLDRIDTKELFVMIPKLIQGKCQACGRCIRSCDCGALSRKGTPPVYVFKKDLCHACLECIKACGQRKALQQQKIDIALTNTFRKDNKQLIEVIINKEEKQARYIWKALMSQSERHKIVLADCPLSSENQIDDLLDWADLLVIGDSISNEAYINTLLMKYRQINDREIPLITVKMNGTSIATSLSEIVQSISNPKISV